jgi:2-hydroxy-3-keto-5-methylthiopentenyl-1-phosphate phosphatase
VEKMPVKPKAIVLCDFDGTAANQDVFDEILHAFGEHPYGVTGTAFDEGRISHRQMNEGFVQSLKCNSIQLEMFLGKTITLRSGFADFHASLTPNNIGFVMVSGGWDIYIRPTLKDYQLQFAGDLRDIVDHLMDKDRLVVACNSVCHDGQSFRYISHVLEAERSAPDKALIATQLKAIYQVPIICIGDGISDYEMAAASDFVFATDRLVKHCAEKNISFLPFTSFEEIGDCLPDIVSKLTAPTKASPAKSLTADFKCD